ncbi:MAG: hypothetical protein DWQ10_12205 [Calditrichaeota bacterium]|nr:MAG: hypothetical protein DWQ10_12205 [Calditrichota bacterium]
MMNRLRKKRKTALVLSVLLTVLLFCLTNPLFGQKNENAVKKTLLFNLMEDIFVQVHEAAPEISTEMQRIAVYHLKVDERYIPPSLRQHIEARIAEIFRTLETPALVSLPEMNTMKVVSTDSSFRIVNTLPSPHELWKIGKRLRIDGFIDGAVTYMPGKAMLLDLKLNKVGTNEVVWSRSFAAYAEAPELPDINPFMKSLIAGLEVYPIEWDVAVGDTLVSPQASNTLKQQTIYFGVHQYLWPKSRLRYEFRFGLAFLTDGLRLNDTSFKKTGFYGSSSKNAEFSVPVSYNIRTMLYTTLVENKNSNSSDWLSTYLALTRHFAMKMPDFTSIGVGFRTDFTERFSFSAGVSMVLGGEFNSQIVRSTDEPIPLTVRGMQYELMLLQISF